MSKQHNKSTLSFLLSVITPALQLQYILGFGYLFCLVVSLFYIYVKDGLYPNEQPHLLVLAASLSS